MSTSIMVEPLDAPMLDFDGDADVAMAGSSTDHWHFPAVRMDEDGHMHSDPMPLEVDMMHFDETIEYEMGDESSHVPQPHEPVDAELIDVSAEPHPQPTAATMEPPAVVEVIPDISHIIEPEWHEQPAVLEPTGSSATDANDVANFVPLENAIPHISHDSEPTTSESQNNDLFFPSDPLHPVVSEEPVQPGVMSRAASINPSESHQSEHDSEGGVLVEGQPILAPIAAEVQQFSEVISEQSAVTEQVAQPPFEHAEAPTGVVVAPAQPEQENGNADNASSSEHEQVYIDPPPPIHLSLHVTSSEGDQPDFVLFNLPESSSSSAEEPLILLQHQPSLYYEPISAVFEAFRSEEYFSHLQELSDAEMAINAHDLQLFISEDNVYAREVSLHDLNAMHHGVGLPGHLRLYLQSVVPRFITRYNQLRDQITGLTFADAPQEEERSGSVPSETKDKEVLHSDDQVQTEQNVSVRTKGLDDHEEPHGSEPDDHASVPVEISAEIATVNNGEVVADEEGQQLLTEPDEAEHDDDENPADPAWNQEIGTTSEDYAEAGEIHEALDADAVHEDANAAPEAVGNEHETEYFDNVAPEADDEEGYGEEFVEDGADGTGTTNVEVAGTALDENDDEADFTAEGDEVASEVAAEAQLMSASTSYDTSELTDGDGDVLNTGASLGSLESGETDHSSIDNNVAEELAQGNYTEEDDIGDEEFGDEDYVSEAGTLGDTSPVDFEEGELDASFVEDKDPLLQDFNNETLVNSNDVASESNSGPDQTKFVLVHKNASKRSVDEADLEDESSPLDSPDSKRSRMQ